MEEIDYFPITPPKEYGIYLLRTGKWQRNLIKRKRLAKAWKK